jgi:late competence protein required for DNA uptake (superfamily II DNA/RNA helicase)
MSSFIHRFTKGEAVPNPKFAVFMNNLRELSRNLAQDILNWIHTKYDKQTFVHIFHY